MHCCESIVMPGSDQASIPKITTKSTALADLKSTQFVVDALAKKDRVNQPNS